MMDTMAQNVRSATEDTSAAPFPGKKRILVAEPEMAAYAELRSKLLALDYEVLAGFSTGEEAVELAARLKPDLVLMDVMLNGMMDGVEAAELIGKHCRIPVVFLSAFSDNETLQRAKLSESFGFVRKPFDDRELHTVIEIALYKHSMEQALRASEEKFSKAFRTSPDSININRARDGLFLDINDGFTALTGYSREEVTGKTSLEINIWADLDRRNALLDGLRSKGEVRNLEADFRLKDGSVKTGLMSATIIELEGELCILSIARDISDRKQSEEALRASEERYREFFEQDLTGDFISTVGGVLVDCNPAFARIFGFASVDDAKKENPVNLYTNPARRSDLYALLKREKKLQNIEIEMRRVDGKPVYLSENLIGIFNLQGEMTHVRGHVIDNTERRALEQALVHAQKIESIGTLASGIAHDFNNVLNNILGFSNQLKKHTADPVKVAKYSESIEKSANRGAGLARQLMSFVRKKNRENVVVNVEEMIDEVIDLASETFPKTITVKKNVAPVLMQVFGDRGELYQALLNLCLNARDAISEQGELVAEQKIILTATPRRDGEHPLQFLPGTEATVQPSWVEISVTDTGLGIPENIRAKIFDPFFTTKERGKGTGLGLSVVYNIVKSHNGSVTVESEEGKGATFRILLPAVESEPVLQGTGELETFRSAQNELIMLVDDEELMRDLGRELLEDAGYRVVIATSGQHAVDLYRSAWRDISLVILDFIMPDMNGAQVYSQLKAINPRLRTFFCTGYAEDEAIVAVLERNGLRAIEKPFKPVRLLKLIKELLTVESAL
jgi:two-component system, cell cycle sensor histidine kinase and response regulator CckA